MADRYEDEDRDVNVPPELDEYICDYVDGTMESSVRDAFEEYLEANPEVAAHVQSLIQTTSILNACADQCPCVGDDFQSRLRCAVENECLPDTESGAWLDRLTGVVLVTSAVTLFCLVVLAPSSVTDAVQRQLADGDFTTAAEVASARRSDVLSSIRYHRDRPAMVRLGPSTPVPPSYVGLRLQPTYRDLSGGTRYLATSASP
jgi:anti-sigma factor RsiW